MRRCLVVAALLVSCSSASPGADASSMDASSRDASTMDANADAAHTPPIFVRPFDAWPTDAGDACYGETFCPGPLPPDPTDVPPPAPPCLPDGGGPWAASGGDPCVHYVDCVGAFAVTYIDGRCVPAPDTGVPQDAGPWGPMPTGLDCVFDEPPTFVYCFGGCRPGPEGRCLNPGPTAP